MNLEPNGNLAQPLDHGSTDCCYRGYELYLGLHAKIFFNSRPVVPFVHPVPSFRVHSFTRYILKISPNAVYN